MVGLNAACHPSELTAPSPPTSTPRPSPSNTPETVKPQPSATVKATPAPPIPITMTVDAVDSGFSQFSRKLVPEFKEMTGTRVEFRLASSWDEYFKSISERAAAGSLDIVEVPVGLMVKAWARFGYIRPLDTYLNPLADTTKGIFPGALEACTISGLLYGLPYAASPGESLLLYNRGLFDASQLAYPQNDWTLEDMTNAADKLNVIDDSGHFKLYGYIPQYVMPGQLSMLRLFASDLFSAEENRAIQPETLLLMLNWYQLQLGERLVFPRPFELPAGPFTLFSQSKAAMLRHSFGTFITLANEAEWLGAALLPSLESDGVHGGYISGLAFCMAKSCPRPAISIEWCKFVSGEANGIRMLQQGCGAPGCRAGAWQAPVVVQKYPISLQCAALANSAQPEPIPQNLRQRQVYSAWLTASEPFWQAQINAAECAETLSKSIQQILDAPSLTNQDSI